MENRQPQSVDKYVATLTKNIQAVHNAARSWLKTSLKRMKRNYHLKGIRRYKYKKCDVVYLLDTAAVKGKCRKRCKPWKGPEAVLQKISSALFRVQLRKSMLVVNHDRMKLCKDRKLPEWLKSCWRDLIEQKLLQQRTHSCIAFVGDHGSNP